MSSGKIAWRRTEDDEQRRNVRRQLDYKLLKLNMTRKRPLDLEDFPEYRDRIIDRLGGNVPNPDTPQYPDL